MKGKWLNNSQTIIRLGEKKDDANLNIRKPSKLPVGQKKSLSAFQDLNYPNNNDNEQISWGFSSFQSIVLNPGSNPSKDVSIEALKNQILFLSKIRNNLKNRFLKVDQVVHPKGSSVLPYKRHITFESETAPLPPRPSEFSSQTVQFSLASPFKPKIRNKDYSQEMSSSEKKSQLNSFTIWNNAHRFFSQIPTITNLSKYLTESSLPDTNVPLGPHYSISINQKLKAKFSKCALRLPNSMLENTGNSEIATNVLFPRLLAAFVDASDCNDEIRNISESSESNSNLSLSKSNSTSNISADFNDLDIPDQVFSNTGVNFSLIPSSIPGTNSFSCLPFEQKLLMEVHFLGLEPNSEAPPLTDNEVMNDIMEIKQELKLVTDETNPLREEITQILISKEPELLQREEKIKLWSKNPPKFEIPSTKSSHSIKRDKLD